VVGSAHQQSLVVRQLLPQLGRTGHDSGVQLRTTPRLRLPQVLVEVDVLAHRPQWCDPLVFVGQQCRAERDPDRLTSGDVDQLVVRHDIGLDSLDVTGTGRCTTFPTVIGRVLLRPQIQARRGQVERRNELLRVARADIYLPGRLTDDDATGLGRFRCWFEHPENDETEHPQSTEYDTHHGGSGMGTHRIVQHDSVLAYQCRLHPAQYELVRVDL